MIYKRFSTILFSALCLFASVNASCKSGESGGANDPSDLSNRLQQFNPSTAANLANYASADLIVNSFNLQSGLTENTCVQNINTQVQQLVAAHYYASQEVDIDSIHCGCNQPQIAADATGKTVEYLRTLNFYTGGEYGHMQGSVYAYSDSRYYLYKTYTSEVRGLIATKSTPPQLNGRVLWFVTSHLQYDSVATRTAQCQELIQYTQGLLTENPDALVIFAGDLYVQHGDADYTELAAYFTDSWVQYSGGYTGGSTYPADNPVLRTDYIWYRAPADLTVQVLSYAIDQHQYSDHARLIVQFGFDGQAPTSTPAPVTTAPATPAPSTSAPATDAPSTSAPATDAPTTTPAPATDAPTAAPTNSPSPTSTPTSPPTNPTCNAFYTLTQRSGGAFTQDGEQLDVYDISIVNKGTCTINAANIAGVTASQSWNFDTKSGAINVFGGIAPLTAYTSSGFIASQGQTADQSAFTYTCSDSCAGTTVPPTVSQCNVMVETTPRATSDGSWTQDGYDYQIWDLSATNYGTTDASHIRFYISVPTGYSIDNSWNLQAEASGTTQAVVEFDLFGNMLAANGGSYSKTSGVIIKGPNPLDKGQVSITLVSVAC